jgi:hypothetical protein
MPSPKTSSKMKNAKTKSILALAGTLVIGMVIGYMVAGHMVRSRLHKFMKMRGGEGFQKELLEAAHPTSEQEKAIKPILAAFSERMDSMHVRHFRELKENLELADLSLAEYLSPDQMESVRTCFHRMAGHGPGGMHGRRGGHGHHGKRGGPKENIDPPGPDGE